MTEPCEFAIIKKDVDLIDDKLQIALETARWSDYDEAYIKDLHFDIECLHKRLMHTKENIDRVVTSLKTWGSQPMYQRHDGLTTSLMVPDSFPALIAKRQYNCLESKKLIDEVMDENFRLFFNLKLKPKEKEPEIARRSVLDSIDGNRFSIDRSTIRRSMDNESVDRPSETNVGVTDKAAQASESVISVKTPSIASSSSAESSFEIHPTPEQLALYRAYEEHVDSVICREIIEALHVSLKYIHFEMDNRLDHDAPVFEVLLELQPPKIVFLPEMDLRSKGLLFIINSMIENILNMTNMIPLVAQPLTQDEAGGPETFTIFLETADERKTRGTAEIEDMQYDITTLARDTIKKTLKFAAEFEKYNFIWMTDKHSYLELFLRYGRVLTLDEAEKVEEGTLELQEAAPKLSAFRDVIEYYGALYEEIKKIETIHVFNSWLKVNMKGLKYRMLNEVSKWSFLFKDYLSKKVISDLNELENFIFESTLSLNLVATNDDSLTLLKILKTITSINDRDLETENMFEPLKKIVDMLKSYDMTFDDNVSNQFAELPERWITLKKLSVVVKNTVAPVQAYQVDLIKKRITMFDIRTRLYYENFMRAPFFNVPCPNPYELCDLIHEELCDMEKQIAGLCESATHFQLEPPEEGKLLQSRKLVRLVKHIWDFLNAVSSCIEDWKKTAWKKINVEDMETECKRFSKDMRNFDKEMKVLKPYLETEAMIKNLLTSLRAITELQNPAIRDRHWNELMLATKVSWHCRPTLITSHDQKLPFQPIPSMTNHICRTCVNWFLLVKFFVSGTLKLFKLEGYPVCLKQFVGTNIERFFSVFFLFSLSFAHFTVHTFLPINILI